MSGKRNAALSFIFITVLVDVIGLGIIIPVLPRLIEQLTGGGLSILRRNPARVLQSWRSERPKARPCPPCN